MLFIKIFQEKEKKSSNKSTKLCTNNKRFNNNNCNNSNNNNNNNSNNYNNNNNNKLDTIITNLKTRLKLPESIHLAPNTPNNNNSNNIIITINKLMNNKSNKDIINNINNNNNNKLMVKDLHLPQARSKTKMFTPNNKTTLSKLNNTPKDHKISNLNITKDLTQIIASKMLLQPLLTIPATIAV